MRAASPERFSAALGPMLASAVWSALASAAPATPVDDIRDIRPLISIPPGFHWLIAGLAAALVVALGYAGVRSYRRRSRRPLSAQQRARLGLAKAEALARTGECHEWGEVVAETLRTALAARLGQAACPETTSELAARDWSKLPEVASVDSTRLVELLSTCDLTRFALGRLEPSALLHATESARAFIERLFAPVAAPASAPTKPAAASAAQVKT